MTRKIYLLCCGISIFLFWLLFWPRHSAASITEAATVLLGPIAIFHEVVAAFFTGRRASRTEILILLIALVLFCISFIASRKTVTPLFRIVAFILFLTYLFLNLIAVSSGA